MARFHVSFTRFMGGASGSVPIFDVRTSATDYVSLLHLDMELFCGSSSPVAVGLGVPATPGVVRLPASPLLSEDAAVPTPGVIIGTDWTTPPTIPAKFIRRCSIYTVLTAQWRLVFPEGLKIAPSSSVVLWGITLPNTTAARIDGNAEFDG